MLKKKIAVVLTIMTAAVVSLTAVSYAAEWKGPADTLASLTGKSTEEIIEAKDEGTGYGIQAAAADVLDEFRSARSEMMQERVNQAVADGRITQETADLRIQQQTERMAACEGDPELCQPARGEFGLKLGDGNGRGSVEGGQCRSENSGAGRGNGQGRANR